MFNRFIKYIGQRHRIPLVSILCLIAIYASAQAVLSSQISYDAIAQVPQTPLTPQQQQPSKKGQNKLIEVWANITSKRIGFDPLVLMDSVVFYHDGAYLYCDSAYYDEKLNTFEAFSNVRMEQGDTLFLYGKYMHYDGNTKLVLVRENVRLESDNGKGNPVTLFTDSLNYDRAMNIGYYFDGGMLVDTLNELTSYAGQYEPNIKLATFKDSVILTNPNFVLYSDMLRYNTDSKVAFISTPTQIVSDSGTIYSSNGWYNTATDESLLLDQSSIVNKEGNRILRGDSILYYKALGYGEVFGNMFLQDTAKHVILRGHYGYYDERTDYAMATDSAYSMEYSQGDTLYIHADTLKLIAIREMVDTVSKKTVEIKPPVLKDSTQQVPIVDSIPPPIKEIRKPQASDSVEMVYRQIKAYYGVRFYRSDIQGVCDSLQFNSKDSVIHMYKDPILWNANRQLYGDTIDIFMNDSTLDHLHVKRSAFSIEQKDSIHFNQLKSRSLKIFFEGKKARRVLAEGSVESIVYPEERNGDLSGFMNYLESSYLEIFLKDGAFDKLVAWPKSVGKTTPFHLLTSDQLRLKDFYWYDYLRPLDKDDIFRKVSRKAADIKPKRSNIFDREE